MQLYAKFYIPGCPHPKKNSKRAFVVGPKFGSKRQYRANVVNDPRDEAAQRRLAESIRDLNGDRRPPRGYPVTMHLRFAVNHMRRVDATNLESMVCDALVEAQVIVDDDIDHLIPNGKTAFRVCPGCRFWNADRRRCKAKGGQRGCRMGHTEILIYEPGEGGASDGCDSEQEAAEVPGGPPDAAVPDDEAVR